ncbi:MAG TPA: glycoside hydrolase family 28 protein [Acidobacteriaceae bacterium]
MRIFGRVSFVAALGVGLVVSICALPVLAAGKVCDVKKYGAVGDGTTKDTVAVQKAIDDCTAGKGGGTVEVPAGTFVIAPILLKSNMTLHLQKGATLLGSPDIPDFPKGTFARHPTIQPLVSSLNAENITINGEGTIDGNGHVWWEYIRGARDAGVLGNARPRPMLVVFDHSKHIKMEGVTVQNSGFWQIVPYYADDLVFRNIRVLAPHSPNTDAIDPFSSSNIVIDHVFASVGDDNVAIKSGEINSPGPDAPSKNITITDCTFENGHGVSIGSEVAGGVQNVHVERVSFKGTDQGIRIKSNRDRGNDISNISFKDITMDGVKTSILISEYYPKAMPDGPVAAAEVQRLTPHFHNIRIENVKSINSAWAGVIVGLPESHVVDIELKNVDIQATKGFQVGYADVKTDGFKVTTTDGSKPVTLGADGVVTPK